MRQVSIADLAWGLQSALFRAYDEEAGREITSVDTLVYTTGSNEINVLITE